MGSKTVVTLSFGELVKPFLSISEQGHIFGPSNVNAIFEIMSIN